MIIVFIYFFIYLLVYLRLKVLVYLFIFLDIFFFFFPRISLSVMHLLSDYLLEVIFQLHGRGTTFYIQSHDICKQSQIISHGLRSFENRMPS